MEYLKKGGSLKEYDSSKEDDMKTLKRVLYLFIKKHSNELNVKSLINNHYITSLGLNSFIEETVREFN
jgi:hypothetical protein